MSFEFWAVSRNSVRQKTIEIYEIQHSKQNNKRSYKSFGFTGCGSGPVANSTGRRDKPESHIKTGTGESGYKTYGTRRVRDTFLKIFYGTRQDGLRNPTGRGPRGIKISCPAHLWLVDVENSHKSGFIFYCRSRQHQDTNATMINYLWLYKASHVVLITIRLI